MTDIFADKTVLLLAAKDGLMQDLTGRHTFEAVGSVPLDNGRAVFDGNSYLRAAAHDDFNFAAGDFTVEVQCRLEDFWRRFSTIFASGRPYFSADSCFLMGYQSSQAAAFGSAVSNPAVLSNKPLQAKTDVHIAVTRENGVLRIFIDGVLSGETNNYTAFDFSAGGTVVGANLWDGADGRWKGTLEWLRVTKGAARYTKNFTPPKLADLLNPKKDGGRRFGADFAVSQVQAARFGLDFGFVQKPLVPTTFGLDWSFSQTLVLPVRFGLDFAVSRQRQPAPAMLFGFSQQATPAVLGADWAFGQQAAHTGFGLRFSFTQHQLQQRLRFDGHHAVGMDGNYDIRVTIGGDVVPMCDFADTMTIRHGENEAYTCTFAMLKAGERKHPRPIDPYVWYAQSIAVDIVHAGGLVRVYQGKVDGMGVSLLTGRFEIRCSDRREQQINNLPHSVIESVGYTSVAAHGNTFDTQADELDKRLETVPASFEFDANGTPYLTSWREKAVADFDVTPCMIYQNEPPRVELAAVGGVLNEVSYTVRLTTTRYLQRTLDYRYSPDLDMCRYMAMGAASLHEIANAVHQTGWRITHYRFTPVGKAGWYPCTVCGRRTMQAFDPNGTSVTRGKDGRVESITRQRNMDVLDGSFSVSRRWTQSVSETYTVTLRNTPSITRYELGKERLNYDFGNEGPDIADKWADSLQAVIDDNTKTFASPARLGSSAAPSFSGLAFSQAGNGDWVAQDELGGDAGKTLTVAFWTAYTKMLSSHRQNTAQFRLKFLPHADLRHTHQITHSHFSGRCKVSAFEHVFDFKRGRGYTDITYRFFQNAQALPQGAADLSEEPALQRLAWRYPDYGKVFNLRRVSLPLGADVADHHQGMIYRFLGMGGSPKCQVEKYAPLAFIVKTPEIEKESTDAAEQKAEAQHEVAVYDTPIVIRI